MEFGDDYISYDEYLTSCKETKEALKLPKKEFCDFEFSPYKNNFLQIFTFYEEALQSLVEFGISPAYLYLSPYFSINARARIHENKYIVNVNIGILKWIVEEFYLNEKLKNNSQFVKLKSLSINRLFGSAAAMFTIYHEIGHLVQNSKFLESNLEEIPKKVKQFAIERHILEIDADLFSSLCISEHLLYYAHTIYGKEVSTKKLELMIVLFTIPFIIYLLSFEGNKQDIYFEEKTHPHPAIRLLAMITSIVTQCNLFLISHNRTPLNQKGCFVQSVLEAEKLQDVFFEDNRVTWFKLRTNFYQTKIQQYLVKILELKIGNASMAVPKWHTMHNSINNKK
ncbi:hypothetical protein [Maribacter sp. IgM3_T14_3]|uniref:hypothetical protein n=1 Tax=Maribacter sp. IgM3_T14_3 TaxID=3415140 RepID=UPI003C6ECCA1